MEEAAPARQHDAVDAIMQEVQLPSRGGHAEED